VSLLPTLYPSTVENNNKRLLASTLAFFLPNNKPAQQTNNGNFGGNKMYKGLFNLTFSILVLMFLVGPQGVGNADAAAPKPNDYTNKFATGQIPEDVKVLAQQVQKPPKGGSYIDPWTEVQIFRVTDAEQNWHRENNPDWASTAYVLHEPKNADNTLVRLTGVKPDSPGTTHHIFRATPPFEHVASLPIEWGMSPIYPRWSRQDPNIIYAMHQGQMKWFNVQTKEYGVVYDFRPHVPDNWSYLGWQDKGDCDMSGRYWPIVCYTFDPARRVRTRTHSHMVFDLEAVQVIDTITMEEDRCIPPLRAAHYPSISSKGNFFWSGGSHGVSRLPGFTDIQPLPSAGHADVGLDDEGNEVMVGFSPRRWQGGNASYIYMIDLNTKDIFWLAPSNPGIHISANYPGWAIVSVYSPRSIIDEPAPTGLAWNDRMIYAVELTRRQSPPPMVVPLATLLMERMSYSDASMANISKDGSIFFHQNWGTSMFRVYRDSTIEYSGDVFMIPAGWDQGLDPTTQHVNHPYPEVLGLSTYQPAPAPTVFRVPDLTGLTQAAAEGAIRDAGFRIGEQFYDPYDPDSVPENMVYKQSPFLPELSVLYPDYAYLTFYINGGVYSLDPADYITVINVVGMTLDDATAALEAVGLTAYVESYTWKSDTIPAGSVHTQQPKEGGLAVPGSAVKLVLSSGVGDVEPPPPDPTPNPEPVTVEIPDVIGMARGVAVLALQSAGLAPVLEYMAVPGFTDYTVADTDPQPGATVEANSIVRVFVALAEAPPEPPPVPPDPTPNQAPDAPIPNSPPHGATNVLLTPELRTDAFTDPDGDAHAQTRWQISEASDFSSLVLNVTSNSHLNSLTVPNSVLDGHATYFWRVRFYDDRGGISGWSEAHLFTTEALSNDINPLNGVPDDQEVDASVDVDNNGIPDIVQMGSDGKYKSLNTFEGDKQIGVEGITNVASIESLKSLDPDSISDMLNRPESFPFGLIAFKLRTVSPGDVVEVKVHFSESLPEAVYWYKYDSVAGWQDYSDHAAFSADRKSVLLELKDGGYGDSDGVANGIIVDPGAVSSVSDTSTDAGSAGGCFIGTAAFGFYGE